MVCQNFVLECVDLVGMDWWVYFYVGFQVFFVVFGIELEVMDVQFVGCVKFVVEIIVDELEFVVGCQMYNMGMCVGRCVKFQKLCSCCQFCSGWVVGGMGFNIVCFVGFGGGDVSMNDFLVFIMYVQGNGCICQCQKDIQNEIGWNVGEVGWVVFEG